MFVFTPPGTKVTLGTRDCAKNFYDYHNLFSSTDPTDKKQALLAYYVRATDSGSSLIDSITANGWNPDVSNRDDGQDRPFQHSPQ